MLNPTCQKIRALAELHACVWFCFGAIASRNKCNICSYHKHLALKEIKQVLLLVPLQGAAARWFCQSAVCALDGRFFFAFWVFCCVIHVHFHVGIHRQSIVIFMFVFKFKSCSFSFVVSFKPFSLKSKFPSSFSCAFPCHVISCHFAQSLIHSCTQGCCFFPLRKCIFSGAATFWVAKLDFLCCWFFSCLGQFFYFLSHKNHQSKQQRHKRSKDKQHTTHRR